MNRGYGQHPPGRRAGQWRNHQNDQFGIDDGDGANQLQLWNEQPQQWVQPPQQFWELPRLPDFRGDRRHAPRFQYDPPPKKKKNAKKNEKPKPKPKPPAKPAYEYGPPSGIIFNDMNEDCMILVLRQFPVQQLVKWRLVCHRWESVILGLFHKKQSIKVFGTREDIFIYCKELPKFNLHRNKDFILRPAGERDDDIMTRRVTFMIAIPEIFPNLKRLTICHYQPEYLWQLQLPDVLAQMPELESLTLFGLGYHMKDMPRRFWTSINSMRNLKELHLLDNAHFRFPFDMWGLTHKMTKFTLIEYPHHIGALIQMLGQMVTHLVLDNVRISLRHLALSLDANPSLQKNLTHLTIGTLTNGPGKNSWLELFKLIADRFKQLEYLDILMYQDIRFYDLTTQLAKLPRLTELSINIGWIDPSNHLANISDCPRLTTIERLSLKDFTLLPADMFIQHFPRIFPCLTFLQVESLSTRFLEELARANLTTRFGSLRTYVPIGTPVHDRANRKKVLYPHAGRHSAIFQEFMYEEYPTVDSPENKYDDIMAVLYEEGGGDDEELIAAALA